MGGTIKTSFWSRVTFSMRSPVAMSNGCAPVFPSYSAITLFTSSMSAVAGSYSRSVVSPRDENVTILAFMFGLLWDVHFWFPVEKQSVGFGSLQVILHRLPELSILLSRANDSEEARPSFPRPLAAGRQHYRTVFGCRRGKKILPATHDCSEGPGPTQ